MPKLPEPWRAWFDRATANRARLSDGMISEGAFYVAGDPDLSEGPDPALLADGLRLFASRGSCPPELLSALADMFDPPAAYREATAKIVRPRGGKAARYTWYEVGQRADELAERDGYASAIAAVCVEFGYGETAAKNALANYREADRLYWEATQDAGSSSSSNRD
ncbi:hypothetical protein ACH0BU_13725 [Sphingomonas olei]